MAQALAQRVHDSVALVARALDLEVVEVRVNGQGPARVVRVLVDREGGVDVAVCELASRRISSELDKLDELRAGYRLEVSSPGVDRPLNDRRSFARAMGRPVLVRRGDGQEGMQQVEGVVALADDDAVVLELDGGGQARIAYEEIVLAKQRLAW